MDKKKKIRYLSIKQEKLEKKLIAEIEKYAPNRPKIPKDSQNPYQYLTTFNNLIGYFREKSRTYGQLFTWIQHHQPFTRINVPHPFESEYKEGGKKTFTKAKLRSIEEAFMSKNYNSKFFEGIEFTNMNNVFDLLNNNQLAEKIDDKDGKEKNSVNLDNTDEINQNHNKPRKRLSTKPSNDARNSLSQNPKKTEPSVNYDSYLDKYKSIITTYGRQLISSENSIKHRKLFNITKLQNKNLYGEEIDPIQTVKSNNDNAQMNFSKNNFNISKSNLKFGSIATARDENNQLRVKTEGEINKDFYLNPFDLKNFSVNKILNNINERNQDKFQSQIEKMRENLKSNSAFLRNRTAESKVKFQELNKREETMESPNNMSSLLKTASKFQINKSKNFSGESINNVNDNSDMQGTKSQKSTKIKKNVKHKSFKSKISCFNPEKKNIKNELQLFRNEFSDKLEKNLQKFQSKNSSELQSPHKYALLDDDNIFNYNAYFKKRYYNKGMRLDLSEKTKKVISEFENKINEACKQLTASSEV